METEIYEAGMFHQSFTECVKGRVRIRRIMCIMEGSLDFVASVVGVIGAREWCDGLHLTAQRNRW